jgi:chromosomal replication initiation ATPase DnaA
MMEGDAPQTPAPMSDRVRARLALQLVAATTGVPVEHMADTRRKGRSCRARWLAMYLAHVTYDWSVERVGEAFGLNRSTAAQACRWAEEGRDRPALDEWLGRLERCVRLVVEAPACELPA